MTREEIGELADSIIQDMQTSKALAKQKPRKPHARFYPDGSIESECSNCKEIIEEEMFIYCPYCGQAIDWED